MLRASLLLVFLAGVGTVAAESQSLDVSISQGKSHASMRAARAEPYSGGPWASVTAKPLRTSEPIASEFRIRAWDENGNARVVVYAVVPEPKGREKEAQIATFILVAGQSVEVVETERYEAAHVTVSAAAPKL